MRKFVVISVNENPEYQFYIPLVVWAWRKFGWGVILIRTCKRNELTDLIWNISLPDREVVIDNKEHSSAMVAQVSRLYAAINMEPDDLIMTSDVDMLPLSDYWKCDPKRITVFGHDLTNYNHMPICYIAMKASKWIEVMGITSGNFNEMINRDIASLPNAKSDNPEKLWCLDQDLITERINAVHFEKEFVHRGTYPNGYPVGRVDRSSWNRKLETLIDCHMPRGIYTSDAEFVKILLLLLDVWPNEDFVWFADYRDEFIKLVK